MDTIEASLNNIKVKRDQYAFEIRKQKANEFLTAKRIKLLTKLEDKENGKSNLDGSYDLDVMRSLQEYEGKSLTDVTDDFLTALNSKDFEKLTRIVGFIRNRLAMVTDALRIEDLFNTGLIPYITKFLDPAFSSHSELQYESLWTLINALAGPPELTRQILTEKLLDYFYKFVFHTKHEFVELVNKS
jgi:hypothetical protein